MGRSTQTEGVADFDVKLKKFKSLQGRAKEEALKKYKDIKNTDLVLVTTKIGSLPEYEVELIKGDPLKFLFDLGKQK